MQEPCIKCRAKQRKWPKGPATAVSYHHRSMVIDPNKEEPILNLKQPGYLLLPHHAPLVLLQARMCFYYTE